jgi:hypothetical protein
VGKQRGPRGANIYISFSLGLESFFHYPYIALEKSAPFLAFISRLARVHPLLQTAPRRFCLECLPTYSKLRRRRQPLLMPLRGYTYYPTPVLLPLCPSGAPILSRPGLTVPAGCGRRFGLRCDGWRLSFTKGATPAVILVSRRPHGVWG